MSDAGAFFAFSSQPKAIGEVIQAGIDIVKGRGMLIHPWTENEISGVPLANPIFENINDAPYVVADVTRPNFNVYFEVGYGIGRGKKVYLVSNSGITKDESLPREIGIFDTLGYDSYQSSSDLSGLLWNMKMDVPLTTEYARDTKSPIYILEPETRTEALTTIISAIKKRARIRYRSFNPAEHIRLSATDAIQNVASSSGVIVPLLSRHFQGHEVHNLRAAFVAGLAVGLDIPTLILVERGEATPLDVRDLASPYRSAANIQDHITTFIPQVVERILEQQPTPSAPPNLLSELSIGDPAAENEMLTLGRYYVRTDAYGAALKGDINLVLGRKGMGKTALFTQVRDKLRQNRSNVVVDLKPEGYQLIRLKEEVLRFVSDGTRAHLVTALWEYVLYLEICYKILEKDERLHKTDHEIYDLYIALSEAYHADEDVEQGDFSERLYDLSVSIRKKFEELHKGEEQITLRSSDVTNLIHRHDLHRIRDQVAEYLKTKEAIWILFDNLDKGWPAQGIGVDDIMIIRCLIDAAKKIQRDLTRKGVESHNIVFVRNDIFELLMSEATDFGKESRSSLDWSGKDFLREVVRSRIAQGGKDTFESVWSKFFVSHVSGEDSYFHIEQRTLMRPRNIIKIISHCKGNAVVRQLDKIDDVSIESGLAEFSNDICVEADREISDVEPSAKGLIYHFIKEKSELSKGELLEIVKLSIGDLPDTDAAQQKIVDFLLYFGFLGVKDGNDDAEYIWDFHYNMQALTTFIRKSAVSVKYSIHPAFWPALKIRSA